MFIVLLFTFLVTGVICLYQFVKPSPSRKCGSVNGIQVTSPRIRLCDGRFIAYKIRGATKENAKYKVILNHGFYATKDTYIPVTDEWLQEFGILLITFDRPGYGESDPNSHRSPKSDALDIQELVDRLDLGPKFYVIGISIGSYPAWGCLKYIPHRLAGAAFVVPIINYWWPSLPSKLRNKAYKKSSMVEQWRLFFVHHAPNFAWLMQRWLPLPTIDLVLKDNPKAFNKSDLDIIKMLSEIPAPDKGKVEQQGAYESLFRDFIVAYGSWEFDPLELTNPFPEPNKSQVHFWTGQEDGIIPKELLNHVAQRLPWFHAHEIPNAGHLLIHHKKWCEMIFKSLVLKDYDPSFH